MLWVSCSLFHAPMSAKASSLPFSFWVWNRANPLTADERVRLHAAGVERLYWQVGELELRGTVLTFRRTVDFPFNEPVPNHVGPALNIIPVVRVSTSIHSPEQFSGEDFGRLLRPIVDTAPGREVQIDFDCPDRLLPIYAERLRVARQSADIHRLTITALAGWANVPASTPLWTAVDSVFPMLYDTEADPVPLANPSSHKVHGVSPCQPRPLLKPEELAAELRSWVRCPVPWYAGLPAFARVTLYDPDGRPRGHLRRWDWEDLVFNPALVLDRPSLAGTTVLRVTRPTRVGESLVPTDRFVTWREAERSTLRTGIADAQAAGASGIILFRLPDPPTLTHSTGGGWSLAQLLTLFNPSAPQEQTPALRLHKAEDGTERWVLRNDSEVDLPPRFAGSSRGYGLELEIAGHATGWRDALPGDFYRVGSHLFTVAPGAAPTDVDQPIPVAIPLARRLTFWFAGLPAHGTLKTGLVQLAPGVDPKEVRFRLPASDHPETTPWQPSD